MRVAILESIVMPAGHEVEFDRILVDELNRQGYEPMMLVPEKFKFKIKRLQIYRQLFWSSVNNILIAKNFQCEYRKNIFIGNEKDFYL